ncbi:PTS glucose transporter subunit IIA, partial [Gilliamella apicola]
VLTPVVISNMETVVELTKLSGSVEAGKTPIMRVKK